MRRPVLLLLAPLLLAVSAAPRDEAERAQRGRRIYLEGVSPSGAEITAVLGEGVELPASSVPCASCHGRDGKGRPEGAVFPSDLTWESLTRPYSVQLPGGRRRPPYDERLLKRAIALGIDAGGTPLHVAMPRFRMSLGDMQDLLEYLRQLGRQADPGVGESEVRIGVLLPPRGELTAMGEAVRAALSARFAEVDERGGLYGRRIELRFLEAPGPPAQRRAATADFLDREPVFSGVAAFLAGADEELASLFEERGVPLVGPFTLHPREGGRYVFYIHAGVESQARALARTARQDPRPSTPRPAVAAPADPDLDAAVKALQQEMEGWAPVRVARYPRESPEAEDLARQLKGADPIFFLGSGEEALALLRAADGLGWRPSLFATAAAADGRLFEAPPAFDGRIRLALPAPPDLQPSYRALAAARGLPDAHVSAQLAALAAAEVLIEGLEGAGRDLTRDRLVEKLEALHRFETGYAPPVTYGKARRLGARGAYLVRLDLRAHRLVPAGGWLEVD